MRVMMRAVEAMGTVESQRRIILDEELPIIGSKRVRLIILLPEETDIDEMEWLRSAARNPVFDFLKDPEEDIYTLSDGRPFHAPFTRAAGKAHSFKGGMKGGLFLSSVVV